MIHPKIIQAILCDHQNIWIKYSDMHGDCSYEKALFLLICEDKDGFRHLNYVGLENINEGHLPIDCKNYIECIESKNNPNED